jgi:uncharacterized protein (TIGR02452 family)
MFNLKDRDIIWRDIKKRCQSFSPNIQPIKYNIQMLKKKCFVQVYKEDTLDFVIVNKIHNPIILIFADDITPGGCVDSGNGMQEESLFRRTYLSSYLKKEMYPIKNDEAIYCKDVATERMSEIRNNEIINTKFYSFLACPCIKFPEMKLLDKDIISIKNKIRLMFNIAKKNNHTNIILGAWGCGVYDCNPKDIALLFKEVINEFDNFNVYFPILGKNYIPFSEILNGI